MNRNQAVGILGFHALPLFLVRDFDALHAVVFDEISQVKLA